MQSAETLAGLQEVLARLKPSLNLNDMLTNVARQMVDMFEVDHSGVLFFGETDGEGDVIAEYPPQGAVGLKVPLTDYPLIDRLKTERLPIAVLDARHDPLMGPARSTMQALGIQSILVIPLVVQDKIVGSLSLDALRQARSFTQAELDLCDIIGHQIAVAVDYTRALQVAEANQRQAQTLRDVNRVLSQSLNLDEILPLILDQLQNVVPADGSSIFLRVEEGLRLVAWRGPYGPIADREFFSLEELWGARTVIEQKQACLLSDTDQGEHWSVYADSPVRSWLGLPLLFRGEILGNLNMDGYVPHKFSEAHVSLAQAFADQAAIAIHNARSYGQAQRRAELLASVQEIGLSMAASLELRDVLRTVATSMLTLLQAGYVHVYLYDAGADSFTLAAGLQQGGEIEVKSMLPRKDGLTATVARTGEPLVVANTLEHPLFRDYDEYEGFKAIIGIPLKKRDEVLGVLNVFFEAPHHFPADEIDLLHLLATQAAVALENARLYGVEQARLEDQARRVEQWRHIQEISATLNSSLELQEVLNNACEQFVRLIEVDHCGVVLFNETTLAGEVVAEFPQTGAIGIHVPLDYPAARHMLTDRQPYASFNAQEDELLDSARATLRALGIKSWLLVPLVVQDQVIGSIGLDAMQQPRQFTEEDLNLSRIVADQIAIAVTNARMYQAERAARVQADTLREVAAILGETLDLKEVLERILAQFERVIKCTSSSIILREADDVYRVVAARGVTDPAQVVGMTFHYADKPHFQDIARSERPLVIPDTGQYGWDQDDATTIKSWIGAPLIVSDRLIGLLTIDHAEPNFYQESDGELVTAFADLAAIALENARLYEFEVKQVEQELNIARQIQRGFFPEHIPDLPGWEIAAMCQPARETGGDFYEFTKRADGLLGLIIGDVSGKSITAAMLMAAAQSVVQAKGSDYRSPAKVLAETNRLLYDDVPAGSFVAVSYALLSPDTSTVCLSNGGQLDPYLVPANGQPVQLIETPGSRLPLGVLAEVDYDETSLSLAPGDMLVFYTDGIVEQNDASGELFGFDRVASVLDQLRGQSPQTTLSTILKAADDFANGVGAHDDVTLIVVQRKN